MISKDVERAIIKNFPGKNNVRLRKEIREMVPYGPVAVLSVAGRVALTKHRGLPGLEAVANVVKQERK